METRQTFTIGQAAGELGVTPSWLRFGERLGAIPLARRTPGGHRYYTYEAFRSIEAARCRSP